MEGLLPIATKTNNGLMSKEDYNCISRSIRVIGSKLYKVLDLSNEKDWQRLGFIISVTTDTALFSQYTNVSYKIGTELTVTTRKSISGGPSIKIYKKGYIIFMYTNWSADTNCIVHIQSNTPIESVGILDDSYVEVPIVN